MGPQLKIELNIEIEIYLFIGLFGLVFLIEKWKKSP